MNKVKDILIFIFGKNQSQRYRRICYLIILFFVGIMLIQNIGYDKEHGFSWRPAANININREIK